MRTILNRFITIFFEACEKEGIRCERAYKDCFQCGFAFFAEEGEQNFIFYTEKEQERLDRGQQHVTLAWGLQPTNLFIVRAILDRFFPDCYTWNDVIILRE